MSGGSAGLWLAGSALCRSPIQQLQLLEKMLRLWGQVCMRIKFVPGTDYFGSTQTTSWRAREMARLIKYVPHKCEEWSSEPSTHRKHKMDLAPGP